MQPPPSRGGALVLLTGFTDVGEGQTFACDMTQKSKRSRVTVSNRSKLKSCER